MGEYSTHQQKNHQFNWQFKIMFKLTRESLNYPMELQMGSVCFFVRFFSESENQKSIHFTVCSLNIRDVHLFFVVDNFSIFLQQVFTTLENINRNDDIKKMSDFPFGN